MCLFVHGPFRFRNITSGFMYVPRGCLERGVLAPSTDLEDISKSSIKQSPLRGPSGVLLIGTGGHMIWGQCGCLYTLGVLLWVHAIYKRPPPNNKPRLPGVSIRVPLLK